MKLTVTLAILFVRLVAAAPLEVRNHQFGNSSPNLAGPAPFVSNGPDPNNLLLPDFPGGNRPSPSSLLPFDDDDFFNPFDQSGNDEIIL
ncbi:hypothetical protein VB005_03239 [Metarhizium brunneum]